MAHIEIPMDELTARLSPEIRGVQKAVSQFHANEDALRRTITEASEMQDMLNTELAHSKEENADLYSKWQAAAAENRRLAGIEQDRQYYEDRYIELKAALEIYANKDNWKQKDMRTGPFDWFLRGNAGWDIAEAALKNNKP